MKTTLKAIVQIAAVAAMLLTAAPPLFAGDEILTVAIFDFESKDDAVRDFGPKIATLVNANLSAEPQIITVERAELEKVLGEQELGLSGVVSQDTAAKVGRLTGAKVLVTGRVFKADKELVIVAKIISSETSRVFGELVKGSSSASITDLSEQLAKKISATISAKGGDLVAKTLTREAQIAAIKKALKPGALPSIFINLPERHFGQAVIDPAAETELGLIFTECGFKLIDDKSAEKADIEITGEAFSAYAMRKGNLISCRSRIEIKAHKKTGEVVLVDRQMSAAVDIAEQTAAKASLQNAALELAARLVPAVAR